MPLRAVESYRPFSHVPGESCILPLTSWKVTAYPTRCVLENLENRGEEKVFTFSVTGPVLGFTIMQDLERGFVRIYGRGREGYYSFRLQAEQEGIFLFVERCNEMGLKFSMPDEEKVLLRKEKMLCVAEKKRGSQSSEKIHFGCHKKQDWTLVKRRQNLAEIIPLWFALGRSYPQEGASIEGLGKLFKEWEAIFKKQDRLAIGPLLLNLFQVGFSSMLVPRLEDAEFQGIVETMPIKKGSPLPVLSYGAHLLRKLFLERKGKTLSILPCLPLELHAGRAFSLEASSNLLVDLEWSKKLIRRLWLHPKEDQECILNLQKDIKSFRLNGEHLSKDTLLNLEKGKTYLFDRFEK